LHEDDYLVYTFNRFEACRFGLAGVCVNPQTRERRTIAEDIQSTLDALAPHAEALGSQDALRTIARIAQDGENDATWLRNGFAREKSLPEVVRQQTLLWRG
jgi:carboxylate-amine ligase